MPEETETSGGANRPGRSLVRESTVAEMMRLHAEAEALARDTGAWSGIAARRRLRDAKNAEGDFLRVLGFATYGEFLDFVEPAATSPTIDLTVPPGGEADNTRAPELERALGAARAEIEELRTRMVGDTARDAVDIRALRVDVEQVGTELEAIREAAREVREMIVEVGAELIVARLEMLVATRRMRAQQYGPNATETERE